MTQLAAVNLLVAALTDLGRLDEIDTAEIEVARGMARAIDDSDQQNAALWREYRAALRTSRRPGAGGTRIVQHHQQDRPRAR